MKNRIVIAAALLLLFLNACEKKNPLTIHIIPKPNSLEVLKASFVMNTETKLVVNDKGLEIVAKYFADQISQNSGIKLRVTLDKDKTKQSNCIYFLTDSAIADLGDEGYQIAVNSEQIVFKANQSKGLFWGVQSFMQLLPAGFYDKEKRITELKIPGVQIKDKPRFGYRGMHLDVCRHIFPVEFIKTYIDMLAMYKFNTFHWHLTEDQGWRIEIKAYPKLAEVAAWRDSTIIGHNGDEPQKWDSKRYGGYYTQEEVKEIVQYAADRQITIIPEIEMPGHSLAALAAYPELACTTGPFRPATQWGVFPDVYCPKEETFEFLEGVLTEIMEMFPGEYIHIGGGECPKTRWKNCPDCQQLMAKEGLENEDELQSYFIRRIEKFLNANGRKIIGWDEILEGGLSPNATVMSWRGIEGGIEAAKHGHDAIMTPNSNCYFDHYQADSETEPLAIGGLTTLKDVYFYEPVPEELSAEEAKHILGAQANVWTEYIHTPEHVQYMVLPRMAALAEVNWSNPKQKNWANFQNRLGRHFKVYDRKGFTYRKGSATNDKKRFLYY